MRNEFYTIAKSTFPAEMVILKGKLESEGIPVFLRDENTINSDPIISDAIGGVKLQVYTSDKERALEIYNEVRNYAVDDNGNLVVCPNCKAAKSEVYHSRDKLLYKLFPFAEPKKYRCTACQFIRRA